MACIEGVHHPLCRFPWWDANQPEKLVGPESRYLKEVGPRFRMGGQVEKEALGSREFVELLPRDKSYSLIHH